jgi:hypothetical protein
MKVGGLVRIDFACSGFQVTAIEQVSDSDRLHVVKIGHVVFGVPERQLHRLDLQVHGLGVIRIKVADAGIGQDAQRHQCGDPLAVGRYLVQSHVVEAARNGAAPVSFVACQVSDRQDGIMRLGKGCNLLGNDALVERLALGLGYEAQGAGVSRAAEVLASPWARGLAGRKVSAKPG